MRRALSWIGALVAGIAVVILVAALIGGRDKSGETIPAGEWAQSVCGTVGVWRGEMEAIVEDVRTPSSSSGSGTEEPQSETPQGRTGFVRKGLERAVEATETMVVGIDNAGVPETAEGEAAAQAVSDWADSALGDLEDAQSSLEEEAGSLEEAVEQLAGAVGALGSTLTSGVETFVEVARLDPELTAAFRDSSTCGQLREETS